MAGYRWRHEVMGWSVWLGKSEVVYTVGGYRIAVRSGGEDEYIRTSDRIFRQVFTIVESKPLPRQGSE